MIAINFYQIVSFIDQHVMQLNAFANVCKKQTFCTKPRNNLCRSTTAWYGNTRYSVTLRKEHDDIVILDIYS